MTRPVDKPPEEQNKRTISLTSKRIAAAAAAALFLIMIGWGLYPYYTWHWTTEAEEYVLEGAAEELLTLDDRLTMTSTMAIATGEKEWITRYYDHKPRRTRAIQDLIRMLPVASEGDPRYADIAEAEKSMTQMEKQAFALLRANKKDKALQILTSAEYKQHKAVFSNGLTKIYREAIASQEDRHVAQMRMFRIAVIGFLVLGVAVLLGWARATKAARQWKHTLAEQRARERKVVGQAVADGLLTASVRYSVGAAGEAAVDGLAMVDLNLTYDYVNPALCRLHKCASPEDMIGRSIGDFLTEDTFNRLAQLTQKVISGEQAQSFEGVARADGQLVQIEIAPSLMSNEEGAPWAFMIIVRDVTKQKQAQEELRKSRDFYLSLFEGFPAPVWRSGIDGGHDYFNSTWFSL
ncbi:MAG: PAS domain S-box protein, partial [Armatimonadetes bacterium]|nr:PAS domain S-box protein [Armatimonadota bacterium]NIM23769.1 PAS domain S-box protein [Armatimonadota bacterium]NIM67646.1 PAS domain S-box protein [Armatimonadota bacterium]NIM76162.1 PAS domain S-box protein [Armatimonadota bacterium]NIN05847.1 PAS domain S-box protein [Armatimonadota bacterium]